MKLRSPGILNAVYGPYPAKVPKVFSDRWMPIPTLENRFTRFLKLSNQFIQWRDDLIAVSGGLATLTDAGRAILEEARLLVGKAEALRARAVQIAAAKKVISPCVKCAVNFFRISSPEQ